MIQDLTPAECNQLLAKNYIGYLAYCHYDQPYIVPITYFFDSKNTIIGYSNEGHKTNAMRKNNKVSLGVSEIRDVSNWTSVLSNGTYEELSGVSAKSKLHEFTSGIKALIQEKEEENLDFIQDFSAKMNKEEIPIVFKITLQEVTGKKSGD
ncbi:pyridoxamine 5'-phosphate oxidase family protein [Polaribacter litorisediminis]|uniref:pyridoxamine 5'-phosphate oxidase family protein n=1 Tax=Polaribacter litorisediminis TaxID=1908341 RepID=UPI001CBCAA2A|nr:pyridoxamine 5'-phosphate oxidase family protein [Polaribacter litorisediminis]UAM96810.1 pyridoxamine 5'-phosphate oxidase family protein [Polaribacter litorisediminis]